MSQFSCEGINATILDHRLSRAMQRESAFPAVGCAYQDINRSMAEKVNIFPCISADGC